MSASNIHATGLVVGDRGVMVRGASGTGKTTLSLALIAAAHASGRFAAFVADDQVLVSARRGRLVCNAPDSIAGLVEIRGRSPQSIDTERGAVIDLVVTLVTQADAPRFAEDETCEIQGCTVAHLRLAGRCVSVALPAIQSWLGLKPFV